MNNNLEEKLKELRIGYTQKLKDTLSSFKDLLADNKINVEELYSKVHTISGTSGMYGLRDLSDVSTEFEFYLKPLKENLDDVNTEELKNKFLDYVNYIEKLIVIGE